MVNDRVRRLFDQEECSTLATILVSAPYNMKYFSGFSGEGYVVLARDSSFVVTDSRFTEQAGKQCPGFTVIEFPTGGVYDALAQCLEQAGNDSIGFEDTQMSVQELAQIRQYQPDSLWQGLGDLMLRIRAVKDEAELDALRYACRITDEGFSHILSYVKEGVSEYDLRSEFDYFMAKNFMASPFFDAIIASGENGSMPHALTSSRKIQHGDMITFDVGYAVGGYGSDLTRTVALGQPNDQLKEIYAIVLEAQERGQDAMRIGTACRDIDAAAREYIEEQGYGKYFGHGLGHGVGLQVHEAPRFNAVTNQILEKNMVVTVEPGIYLPGLGGVRIENTCIAAELGCEPLFKTNKELIIL